ncbi:MAG TPA: biosynthetic peptidoglycan transglycosylase, partial [Solirubrobacterales bacterium]|nr:biosynthetic peptidoglycan transglycosylase [Solirubrobacterales bacterium]
MTQRNRRRQRRHGGIGAKLLPVLGGVFALLAIATIAVASWVLDVAADAPSLSSCKPIDRGGNTVLYAADGSKLGMVRSPEVRSLVSIERVPKTLQLATVAIEDQRFYEHEGLDFTGIARAALKDLEAGEVVEGASTITQQLVRNLCIPNPKRTLERKIEEAQLAVEYAERHSRKEILGSYLNVASYGTVEGSTAVGVGAASQIFFSKPVWKLKLPEAALLAGLPQAPSEYNP